MSPEITPFCYDTEKEECWQVKEGLKDNFIKPEMCDEWTLSIPIAIPIVSSKSGRICGNTFPAQAQGESLVLFYREIEE